LVALPHAAAHVEGIAGVKPTAAPASEMKLFENSAVKFYARTGNAYAPTASQTNGALLIAVANSSLALTTNDVIMYVHANGTLDYDTIAGPITTTNITLTTGLTVAGASGDYIYELSQQGQIVVGYDGAGVGTNDGITVSGDVFVTPGRSPLYAVLDSTSNATLQVTADIQ
jgi:hypothetical protein